MRIGGVHYGVGAPLLTGLAEDPDVELLADKPRVLIPLLREGALDAALLSSIEAFRWPGYRLAPGLGICSRGPARSVRAFRRPDIAAIHTVGLDNGSATSVALLEILLRRGRFGPITEPLEFKLVEPMAHPDRLPFDLVLLIGDFGLRAEAGQRQVLDLGDEWFRWTGLPFVYALWVIHPSADPERLIPRLRQARDEGISRGVLDGTGGAIYYTVGEPERAGLSRFCSEAIDLGLAAADLEPMWLDDIR
ncbi:MAG: hypothetical protein H6836_10380 [Planctomycetes bacterium]|nr:hypothetical protein [Planctomycetota bacterium]MCB9889968.1 hypothetical protein [Planctomycetota bacterium]